MQAVAVGWLIYDITPETHSTLAWSGFVQFIPAVLFVLFAGHAADRYDRRIIIRVCQSVLWTGDGSAGNRICLRMA